MNRPSSTLLPTRIARILRSPVLLVCLLAAASFLATTLLGADAKTRAPYLSAYDCSKHSDVLLIVYPLADSCSTCNLSLDGWTKKGFAHNLEVLVVATDPNPEIDKLRKAHPQPSLSILANADESLIRRFSNNDKIGGVRIRNGRILQQQQGASPSEDFWAQRG